MWYHKYYNTLPQKQCQNILNLLKVLHINYFLYLLESCKLDIIFFIFKKNEIKPWTFPKVTQESDWPNSKCQVNSICTITSISSCFHEQDDYLQAKQIGCATSAQKLLFSTQWRKRFIFEYSLTGENMNFSHQRIWQVHVGKPWACPGLTSQEH